MLKPNVILPPEDNAERLKASPKPGKVSAEAGTLFAVTDGHRTCAKAALIDHEAYSVDVPRAHSGTFEPAITGVEERHEWQVRPLASLYPVIFFDAMRVRVLDTEGVKNKTVRLALGIRPDGSKDFLGIWVAAAAASFWSQVMRELKNRGVNDILISMNDSARGFPEAIGTIFPETEIQTSLVHLIRTSLQYADRKDQRILAFELKKIHRARDAKAARIALDAFDAGPWGDKYPAIAMAWRRHWRWEEIIPFLAYPATVHESIKTRGHFPSDAAAADQVYLALRSAPKRWEMSTSEWTLAMTRLAAIFPDRFAR